MIKIFVAIIFIQLTGCYTVIYSPDMDYGGESDYTEESYYDPGCSTYEYYVIPWWFGSPVTVNEPLFRGNDMQTLRGNGGGRNEPNREDPILVTPPPSRTNDNSGSQNSGSNNTHTKKENRDDNSRNETRTKNDDSNQKNSIRNNDGSRNNDKKRK